MNLYAIRQISLGRDMYIGYTRYTVERRYRRHLELAAKDRPKTKLHRAIKKYGVADFEARCIAKSSDADELKDMEKAAILLYGTYWKKGGYNLTLGGDGTLGSKQPQWAIDMRAELARGKAYGKGYKHTEAARTLISEAALGHKHGMTGKHHTDDTRQRLRELNTGENHPQYGKPKPEHVKAALLAANVGKKHTAERNAKVSAALKDKPKSDEHRAALSVASKGKPKSEAHKAALKAAWARRRVAKLAEQQNV